MKHVWIVVVSIFIASSAAANVRAPTKLDGDVVIAKLAGEAAASLSLSGQKLVVRLPRFIDKKYTSYDAEIKATYTFQNDGAAVTIPMVFLATGIDDAAVMVNGAKPISPTTAEMNDAQREELKTAVDTYAPPSRTHGSKKEGSTANFELRFEPGENVVTFTYSQTVGFDEGGTRYGEPVHDDSETDLTYLLYPCRDWKKADDFALDVSVIIPDYQDDGWFWDTYWEPSASINLALAPTYDEEVRRTTYAGQFDAYPEDVLSIKVKRGPKR